METLFDPVPRLLAGYQAAVLARDVEAFCALYAGDVRVFDLWGRWSYDGLDAWRATASEWFGSLGSERVAVKFEDVRVRLAPDLAVASAFVAYEAVDPAGAVLRGMANRWTAALARQGDDWRIVHEHTSAPVDPDSLKALLAR